MLCRLCEISDYSDTMMQYFFCFQSCSDINVTYKAISHEQECTLLAHWINCLSCILTIVVVVYNNVTRVLVLYRGICACVCEISSQVSKSIVHNVKHAYDGSMHARIGSLTNRFQKHGIFCRSAGRRGGISIPMSWVWSHRTHIVIKCTPRIPYGCNLISIYF